MTKREAVTGMMRKFARLPEEVPAPKVWQMGVSVVIGFLLALAGVALLYVWSRVYIKTDGGASSWPLFIAGIVILAWGGNHASRQFVKGGLASSLSALAHPVRRMRRAVADEATGEHRTDGDDA